MYESPWDDPDWYSDEGAATDVRTLFAIQLGELLNSNSAEPTVQNPRCRTTF